MSSNIWYRSSAAVNVPAWEDRGALTVERGTISFSGAKKRIAGQIRSVSRAQMGTNRWVHVEIDAEGVTQDAYFMDGGLLGWAGVLGGNKRLAARLQAAAV